jgi:hypothetical protein
MFNTILKIRGNIFKIMTVYLCHVLPFRNLLPLDICPDVRQLGYMVDLLLVCSGISGRYVPSLNDLFLCHPVVIVQNIISRVLSSGDLFLHVLNYKMNELNYITPFACLKRKLEINEIFQKLIFWLHDSLRSLQKVLSKRTQLL